MLMGEQDVLKMQQRKDFLIKFCYWAVITVCVYAVFKYLLPVLFSVCAGIRHCIYAG